MKNTQNIVVKPHFTDRRLLKLCKKFGRNALKWRQKFVSLLPEVNKRKLYLKKDCSSIFEFAARFGGISNEQVARVLNLEKRLEDKPILKSLFESGEVSSNKIMRVVSIATKENEARLADHLRLMSQKAVETFVRDEKHARNSCENPAQNFDQNFNQNSSLNSSRNSNQNLAENPDQNSSRNPAQSQDQKSINFENENGLDKTKSESKSVRAHTSNSTFEFNETLTRKLNELQEKGFDLNQLLLELIEKREEEIEETKEQIAEEINSKRTAKRQQNREQDKNQATTKSKAAKASRYIPVKIKRILKVEYGDKCSIPICKNKSEEIHHEHRFSLLKNLYQRENLHDPRHLKPLCKAHHQIAHTIDVKYNELRMRS